MTIGFIYSGSSYATPDKGLSRQTKHAVNVSKFGDGYEQRVAKGINSQGETYNLQFNNRTAELIICRHFYRTQYFQRIFHI